MSYLLESVTAAATERGARRVTAVNIVMGERAGIDDSLLFYFDLMTPGTLAEGARLNVRRTPMRFHCAVCQSEYTPRGATFACPGCTVVGRLVDGAGEVALESLEIET